MAKVQLAYISELPSFLDSKPVDKDGNWTPEWRVIMQAFMQFVRVNLNNEGIILPPISSANSSVTPPETGGQLTIITPGAANGTVVYDPNTDQPKIKLATDGLFHQILTA